MARLSKRALDDIVKRDLPGYKIVSRGTDPDAAGRPIEADQVGADIDTLRKKYLEGDAGAAGANPEAADEADAGPNTDDEIVVVQPERPGNAFDHAARPKTVVVSGREGRVIGSQG